MLGINLLAIETMRGHGEHSVHCVWVGEGDETKTAASLQRKVTFIDFEEALIVVTFGPYYFENY